MILLIDNTDSFTFNLYQMLQAQTSTPVQVVRNHDITLAEIINLQPDGVVLSPGPGHPAVKRDFGVCREVITEVMTEAMRSSSHPLPSKSNSLNTDTDRVLNCPILGVCLGHQGIAHYLGGKLAQLETVVHGKTAPIRIIRPSPLFHNLPPVFAAMRYHSWVVSEEDFPPMLEVTAVTHIESALHRPKLANSTSSGQRVIMAFQHRSQPIYGVQFHPESIGTPYGTQILKNFLQITHRAHAMSDITLQSQHALIH